MNELHEAARAGNLIKLRRLIAEGSPIDAYEELSGHTPLMAACTSQKAGSDVVRLLIANGANVNASLGPTGWPERAYAHLEPEMRSGVVEMVRERHRESLANPTPLIRAVVETISDEKLRLLVEAGADVDFKGSTMRSAALAAARAGNTEALDYLIEIGARQNGIPAQGPVILATLSSRGHFAQIRRLLALGMDPSPLRWTPLMHAVASGSLDEVAALAKSVDDLEAIDASGRTAFYLSVAAGEVEKAAFLLTCGAQRSATGQHALPALFHAVERDDTTMVRWLLEQGFDPNESDEVNRSPLMMAYNAPGCFRMLLDAGADLEQRDNDGLSVVDEVSDVRIARMLIGRGVNPARFSRCVQREVVGLGYGSWLSCTKEDYLEGRCRRFGRANPERMNVRFWDAMVRCGWDAFRAAVEFDDWPFAPKDRAWSQDRRGMSLTALPDGRFVHIGGRDDLLPLPGASCVHNDLVVYNENGEFEILGYPAEVFPPVEFHSATYVAPWIYIIGNASYPKIPEVLGDSTPVHRFHCETGVIETVASSGESPGWIHGHQARLEGSQVRVWGGEVPKMAEGGRVFSSPQTDSYRFDPASGVWERISAGD